MIDTISRFTTFFESSNSSITHLNGVVAHVKSPHFPVGKMMVVAPDVRLNCRVIETLFAPLIAIKKSGLFIQIRISMSPYALWSEVTIDAFVEVKRDGCFILTVVDTSNIVHINTIEVVSNLYQMPREY